MEVRLNSNRILAKIETNDDQWHHYALVRRGNEFYLYIDGEKEGYWTTGNITESIDNAAHLVALKYFGDLPHSYFKGSMDHIRFWKTALTAGELNQPIQGDEADLIGYYEFSQIGGTTLPDATGKGHTGTIKGPGVWGTTPSDPSN